MIAERQKQSITISTAIELSHLCPSDVHRPGCAPVVQQQVVAAALRSAATRTARTHARTHRATNAATENEDDGGTSDPANHASCFIIVSSTKSIRKPIIINMTGKIHMIAINGIETCKTAGNFWQLTSASKIVRFV